MAANAGFVDVGTDHDTPAFAVEPIRRWWDMIGKDRYPGVRRLLITAELPVAVEGGGGPLARGNGAGRAGAICFGPLPADLAADAGLGIEPGIEPRS